VFFFILLLRCLHSHAFLQFLNPFSYPQFNSILPSFISSRVSNSSMITTIHQTVMNESDHHKARYREFESRLPSKLYLFRAKKPKASMQPTVVEELRELVRKYCGFDANNWDFLGKEDEDIMVWRLKRNLLDNMEAEKWPCVKATAVINVPCDELGEYLLDSSYAPLFNKYCSQKSDIDIINNATKITWNRTKAPFNIKPFDFCTIVHCYKNTSDSSIYIVSKATQHAKVPIHKDYVRSETLFGLNILSPSGGDGSKTALTTFSHVKYTGTPPLFAWKNGFSGTVSYLKHLKEVAVSLHERLMQREDEEEQQHFEAAE